MKEASIHSTGDTMSHNKKPVQQLFSPEKEEKYGKILSEAFEFFGMQVEQNVLSLQELPAPYCLSEQEIYDKVSLYAKESAEFVARSINELAPHKGCGGGLKSVSDREMRDELFKLIPQKTFPAYSKDQIQTIIDNYGCATVWAVAKRLERLHDLEKHHLEECDAGLVFLARLLRGLADIRELHGGTND